jgi:hypothetical protein
MLVVFSRYIMVDLDASACDETYVTLCVYPKDAEIFNSVCSYSKIPPTSTSSRDGVFAWFWSTESVRSLDVGDHLKFMFNLVSNGKIQIETLKDVGCKCWLSCFWVSKCGNGGPGLEADVLVGLAQLALPLYFDIYFAKLPLDGSCAPS